ncbi:MAG: histidine kinase [Bacteroidales bacterium]|nr:histidine kinase [Bacteroidales bacterium]
MENQGVMIKIVLCKKLITLFLLITANVLIAQPDFSNMKVQRLASENYIIEKGLSQNSVFSILQDKRGFLWFGTWDGLNKYDGYDFQVFKSNFMDAKTELSNQTILSLFEDSEGLIWIGTNKGLNVFDRNSKTFRVYKKNIGNPGSISSDTILSINEDLQGYIWIGTQTGLNRIDKKSGKVLQFFSSIKNPNESLLGNSVFCIYADKNGFFWIGTNNGLNRLSTENIKFSKYCDNYKQPNSLCGNVVRDVCCDKNGKIWAATNNGLFKLDQQKGVEKVYRFNPHDSNTIPGNNLNAIAIDQNGYIWIGTKGAGLSVFDPKNEAFTTLEGGDFENNLISADDITCIYIDKTNIVWVGTNWKGVNKINLNAFKFDHYKTSSKPNSLNSDIVWGMCEIDEKTIWIGTDKGINIFDRNTQKFSYLTKIPGTKNSLSSNQIRSFLKDSKGNIWIGTFGGGLNKYNPKDKTFLHFGTWETADYKIKNDVIWTIFECSDGYIWVGSEGGFCKINPETYEIINFTNNPSNPESLSHNSVFHFLEDHGSLWISTYNGINILDKKTGEIERMQTIKNGQQTVSIEGVFYIHKDKNEIFWISTIGGGLMKYDLKTGIYKIYNESNGLPNNVIYCTLEDLDGNIWMTTNYGVSKFDKNQESFLNFSAEDGIQSNEFNLGSHLITHDGLFLVGGMGGFNIFHPGAVKKNTLIPPVVITSIKILNEEITREYHHGDVLELDYNQNFISFEFSALDFTNPTKNKYAYKLTGIDKEWKYSDATRRFADYKQLDPGKYTFTIKASNNDGVWNDEGISITIIIKQPWWQTWAFRIPFFGGLFLIISLILLSRFRGLKRKHSIEKKILDVEKQLFDHERKALRLQMNPHFIFNTLNSIQYFILQNDKLSSNRYLTMFSKLMRLTLDNSQHNTIVLNDELESLKLYVELESLRFEEKFDYKFEVDENLALADIQIPSMIIQPYVENAIKHGLMNKEGKGELLIIVKQQEDDILCIVEDDGVGREKADAIKKQRQLQHVSLGTKITEDRLRLINMLYGSDLRITYTDLKDGAGIGCGTRVSILIPIMNNNPKKQ